MRIVVEQGVRYYEVIADGNDGPLRCMVETTIVDGAKDPDEELRKQVSKMYSDHTHRVGRQTEND